MDGRADIMHVAGKRQLRRAGPAPRRRLGFDHQHGTLLAGNRDRRRQSVGTCANNDRVVRAPRQLFPGVMLSGNGLCPYAYD